MKISLLVPCYNEEKSLEASIQSCLKQNRKFDEIIFVDACYDEENHYALACSILKNGSNLSHHIQPQILMALMRDVYEKKVDYSIYSMLTCNFEMIEDTQKYYKCIDKVTSFLIV